MAITALSEAAVTQTVIGRLRQSVREMDELVGYANSLWLRDGRKPPAMGILYRHKGLIHFEKNELQEAEACCREAIAICKQWGEKESLQHAHFRLTLTLFAVGDRIQAEKEMERCFSLARSISPAAESSISTLRQHSLLLKGETAETEAWVQEYNLKPDDEFGFDYCGFYSIYARLLMALGKYEDALKVTGRMLQVSEEVGAGMSIIRYQFLKAIILEELGRKEEAMQLAGKALDRAEPEGYIRSFLDAGPLAAKMLYQAACQGIHTAYCNQLLDQFPSQQAVQAPTPVGVEKLVDELSGRELEVLGLIKGAFQPGDAAELVLSLHTVKSHVRHIFRSWGSGTAPRRWARARLLGLLSQDG